MGRIFLYSRVSTPEQEQALAQQDRQAEHYAAGLKLRDPKLEGPLGPYREKVSGFKFAFNQRPVGKQLLSMLQPGDHIVFSRVDRFGRNLRDFCNQIEEWRQKDVHFHFADTSFDLSSPMGIAAMQMAAVFAELYSRQLSEKMKASYRERYIHGTQHNSRCSVLVRKIQRPGLPPIAGVNEQTLVYLRYVVHRRRVSYLKNGVPDGWHHIANDLERLRVERCDIAEYRKDHERGAFMSRSIAVNIRKLMTSEVPALNRPDIVRYFRQGLNPFKLGSKTTASVHLNPPRENVYQHFMSLTGKQPKRRRWSKLYECCVKCGKTAFRHASRGVCKRCLDLAAKTTAQKADDAGTDAA